MMVIQCLQPVRGSPGVGSFVGEEEDESPFRTYAAITPISVARREIDSN